jgi:hypothetical protein
MTDPPADAPEPDVSLIYDELPETGMACRVCGALVPGSGDYPRIHWDWHEATNGA